MIVRATERATAEYRAAYEWYDERSPQAARRFALSLDEVLERLQVFPSMGAVVRGRTHRVRIPRYPWAAYYVIEDDTVLIVRVVHDRRSRELLELP